MVRSFILILYGWFLAFILYVNFIYAFDLFDTIPQLLPGLQSTNASMNPHPSGSFFGISSLINWFQHGLTGGNHFDMYFSIQGAMNSVSRSMGGIFNYLTDIFDNVGNFGVGVGESILETLVIYVVALWSIFIVIIYFILSVAYVILFVIQIIMFVVEMFMALSMIFAGYFYSPLPHNPYILTY